MKAPRICWKLAALFLVAPLPALCSGCGGAAEFDRRALYTPESIAQELSFRFRELSGDARKLTRARPERKAVPLKEHDLAKSGEAKKESPANNADAVCDDIARKIRALPGPTSEVCKQVIEALRKDVALNATEKDDLTHRIEAIASGNGS